MREECKHFQSRTYASGEVARFCVLDLAPEAPWRCPADCPRYEARRADAGWVHGTLVDPAVEEEPEEPAGEIGDLLDQAEDIVNSVVPETRLEVAEEQREAERPAWQRIFRRFRRRKVAGRHVGGAEGGEPGFGGRR